MTPLATLFVDPMEISSRSLWMVIPVCIGVAVVYKTIRTRSLRRLPLEVALLSLYILAGIAALMTALWALLRFTYK